MSCPCQALAYVVVKVKVAQSCLTLRPHGLYSPWNSPDQNTGVGSLSFLQGIFPTQGSNRGLLHCRRILYQLSHREAPKPSWKRIFYLYVLAVLSLHCCMWAVCICGKQGLLSSCSSRGLLTGSGAQAQELWPTGSAAPWRGEASCTDRDRTRPLPWQVDS